jgi:non-specific serine/threonine protein kinase
MTVLLRHYWLSLGLFTEGRRWHGRALAVGSDSPEAAWAVYGAGVLTLQQGDLEQAEPLLARAAELAQERHDRDLRAHVTDAQAIASFFAGDLPTAGARHESALAEYAEIGFSDPFALVTFTRLAAVCCLTGELDRAISLSEECLRISEELGEQWSRGTALWTRGAARWLSGDVGHAVEDTLACLRIKESLGDLHTITMAIDLLAVCLVAQEISPGRPGSAGPETRSGRCCARPSSKARITPRSVGAPRKPAGWRWATSGSRATVSVAWSCP